MKRQLQKSERLAEEGIEQAGVGEPPDSGVRAAGGPLR